MSTLVVVRKNGVACIAAETLTMFGSRKHRARYSAKPEKIISVGSSYVGGVGAAATEIVLESVFARLDHQPPNFSSRLEIFDFFNDLHKQLKEGYFLNPKEDEHDPFESSQLELLVASTHGIFGVTSLREVFEYTRFWAVGSGSSYALGAMHALYDRLDSAREVAEQGVAAAVEFDDSSELPITAHTIEIDE